MEAQAPETIYLSARQRMLMLAKLADLRAPINAITAMLEDDRPVRNNDIEQVLKVVIKALIVVNEA